MAVDFLGMLRGSIVPATGCTEPCAIALNAAVARANARGECRRLTLRIDEFLFKNAMGVGIPGTSRRGVALCAAMGLVAGDPTAGLNVLRHVAPDHADAARRLVEQGLVSVEVVIDCDELFLQSTLTTDEETIRVTTLGRHDNIARIERAPFPDEPLTQREAIAPPIAACRLADMLAFVRTVPAPALAFLQDGVDMNLAVARAGEALPYGRAMCALPRLGALGDGPIARAKLLCACAAYARMSGLPLPVMTATGSGNQGITVTLTIEGAAQSLGVPQPDKLRALALAHLVNLYAKAHIGTLSALCSCGIASGLGASAGVVLLLGGGAEPMLLAARNMIGSICGMICDGAKEGCANKVELAAGLAVQSAYLAIEGVGIPPENGILSDDWETLFANLGALCTDGMRQANRVIVDIMRRAAQGDACCMGAACREDA